MKKYTISFILFLIGILCAIIYQFKGSSVDVNGFLQEPFYLAATSSIAIWAGLFSMLGISLFNLKKGEKLDKTFAIISGVAIFLGLISSVISYKYIYKNEDNRGQAVITNSTTTSIGGQDNNVGTVNPASKFCVDNGGTLFIKNKEDGSQYGLCYFDDNRACEEWAMMRGDCSIGGVKTTGYDTIDQMFCAWSGGQTYAVENSVCTFKNGEKCSTVDFYNGKCTINRS